MLLNQFCTGTFIAIMCAVIGFVYIRILKNEPILSKWFLLGAKFGLKQKNGKLVRAWWYKPLFECEKCLSGQMALWSYLVIAFHGLGYNPLAHVYTVCLAIGSALIFSLFFDTVKGE